MQENKTSLRIPCELNLKLQGNKAFVDDLIMRHGLTKDVNEVGIVVYCRNDEMDFRITQFSGSRHVVSIAPGH